MFRQLARRALLGAVLLGVAATGTSCREAGAAQGFAKRAYDQTYVTMVVPIGDSITFGVNAETDAGWRERLYNLAAASSDRKIYFTGTQSFAGNGNGLAADPFNEGRPAWCIGNPNGCNSLLTVVGNAAHRGATVAILAAGTNDLAAVLGNQTAAAALASMSTWLDSVWAVRTTPRYQIVLFAILKRLDADNPKVIEFNAGLSDLVASKSYWQNITLCSGMYDAITRPAVGTGVGGYADVVHPNNEGYRDMATTAWPCLRTAIGKQRPTN